MQNASSKLDPISNGDKRDDKGRFLPGNHASPGRPVGSVSVVDEIRRTLMVVADIPTNQADKRTWLQLLVRRAFHKAVGDGDVSMIKAIIDHVDGTAPGSLDLTTGNKPMSFKDISKKDRDAIKAEIIGQLVSRRSGHTDKNTPSRKTRRGK